MADPHATRKRSRGDDDADDEAPETPPALKKQHLLDLRPPSRASVSRPSRSHSGRVTVVRGPMFCGKTTRLHEMVRRLRFGHNNCHVAKPMCDVRSPKGFTESRSSGLMEATEYDNVDDILKEVSRRDDQGMLVYDVLGVDEAQFFPGIERLCDEAAALGLQVVVAGLDWTWAREPFDNPAIFGDVTRIRADKVIHLTAVCMVEGCDRDAAFTQRTRAFEGDLQVGGSETYRAVCRGCYDRDS